MTDRMNRNHDIPIKEHDICRTGGGKVLNVIDIGQLNNFCMFFM